MDRIPVHPRARRGTSRLPGPRRTLRFLRNAHLAPLRKGCRAARRILHHGQLALQQAAASAPASGRPPRENARSRNTGPAALRSRAKLVLLVSTCPCPYPLGGLTQRELCSQLRKMRLPPLANRVVEQSTVHHVWLGEQLGHRRQLIRANLGLGCVHFLFALTLPELVSPPEAISCLEYFRRQTV